MIKKILFICIIFIILCTQSELFAFSDYQEVQTYYANGLAEKGIPVLKGGNMVTKIPEYTAPDIEQKNLDIAYWIQLLPKEFQQENEYFIFPKAGMIIPVVNMTPEDRVAADRGESIEYLHYLQQGTLHHRGKKPSQGAGNFTLAGHTAYYANDPGHFKTAMQGILLANPGDTLIYVRKTGIDSFHRYLYTVQKTFETTPEDVSILLPKDSVSYELTAYGCSPVGSIDKRWIVKASLTSSEEVGVSIEVPVEEPVAVHAAAPEEKDITLEIPESSREEIESELGYHQVAGSYVDRFYSYFLSFAEKQELFLAMIGYKISRSLDIFRQSFLSYTSYFSLLFV